jgi:DNA (cytosine-5)-methyltransferase 1
MRPRLLSLCTGYGGLDHAAEDVFDAELVAVSDIDPGANKILAHRYPNVPNLGDLKTIDWDAWAGVEIMTAGYPCQPFSHAGKRAGTDDPRHIFPWIVEGIRRVGPRLVLLENVRGHLRLGFDVVLGALADVGYDARWVCLRASDVGACHKRERLFIAATPADADGPGLTWAREPVRRVAATPWRGEVPGPLLKTPTAQLAVNGGSQHPDKRKAGGHGPTLADEVEHLLPTVLLPTPAVNDMGRGKTVEAWDEWTARMKAAHGNGNGHGPSLEIEAMRLLPTPRTGDNRNSRIAVTGANSSRHGRTAAGSASGLGLEQALEVAEGILPREFESWDEIPNPAFGKYAAAIARQETAFGHPAPPPTEPTGKNGAHRLSPRFVEWMQGCEPGWVTDVPGLSRNEQLKALGNGVVRQQAAAAIRFITTPLEAVA